MLTIYTLSNCSTCRDATKWLRARNIPFAERAIRETPPSAAELRTMLAAAGGEVRKLFNASGERYREQRLSEKLPALTTVQALALLAADGHLVKRPFLVGEGVALVGFKEVAWEQAFPIRRPRT